MLDELATLLHGAASLVDGLRDERGAGLGWGERELRLIEASQAIHVALVATGGPDGAGAEALELAPHLDKAIGRDAGLAERDRRR